MSDFLAETQQRRAFLTFWAQRWAPVGAANDPQDLNRNWPANVSKLWLA
jgi:hypothetical protein